MAMIKCPGCGREISTIAPACPGCGILKEDIQKLLGPDSGNQKPVTRKMRKMLTCVACHVENEEGTSHVCKSCGYPLLSLSSDKKKVKKAVEIFNRREDETESEKPVQVTKNSEKPELPKTKPKPITQERKLTPPTPSTDKKSGKTKAIVAAVACVGIFIGLFFREKTEPQPVASAGSNISTVSESTESIAKLSGYYNIGDTVTFGSCEQDNNPNNGKEEIRWIVLDKDEKGYLLLSEKGLDSKPYNDELADVTWETCTLRTWLNEDFYNTAFESKERQQIRTTQVVAEKNPYYDTKPGNDTDDPVFLLSIQEAEKYFDTYKDRKTCSTEYAKANGANEDSSTKCCWWWLRSPGNSNDDAAVVDFEGRASFSGFYVHFDAVCVRPAIWVNL